MVQMPQWAPLVVLAFLGSAACLALCSVLVVFFWLTHRWHALRLTLVGAIVIGIGYLALLLGRSILSEEIVLRRGERKYFCEIDCHLAMSVTNVRRTKTLHSGARELNANGVFYIVSVQSLFDENTISPRRGREAPLYPTPRRIVIWDAHEHEYSYSVEGTATLGERWEGHDPLYRPIHVGESFSVDLVFDVPDDIESPTLYITADDPIEPLLIGHERSPLHKGVVFSLEPAEEG